MIEFVEYADDQIRLRLPKQLRQQRFMRFFRGNLVRGKPETQVIVTIVLDLNAALKKAHLEADERQFAVLPAGCEVLRFGSCNFGGGGREIFTSSEIFDKGYKLFRWQAAYSMQGRYVVVDVAGGGSREDFESMAREIITSLTLLSPAREENPPDVLARSAIKSERRDGMRTKDKARLAKALALLPETLAYLRDPILSLAEEDQDMLGTGDVDTAMLAKALEQQAVIQPRGFAAAQAKALKQWLTDHATLEEAWVAPVSFVVSFLLGRDMFEAE